MLFSNHNGSLLRQQRGAVQDVAVKPVSEICVSVQSEASHNG